MIILQNNENRPIGVEGPYRVNVVPRLCKKIKSLCKIIIEKQAQITKAQYYTTIINYKN